MGPVILSGCSGGIGRAIAKHLSLQKWRVIGIDLVKPGPASSLDSFYQVDLSQVDSVHAVCRKIRSSKPRIWGLIHCAGIYPITSLDEYTPELWDQVHSVNVRAAFLLVNLLHDRIANGGRIIFVASAAAYLGSADVGYSASKSGLVGLVRGLAKNLATRKILVNAVCPGPIKSPMSARMRSLSVQAYLRKIPLRRFGYPKEVTVPVEFLLNPKNTYMTGTSLDVSGGLGMH